MGSIQIIEDLKSKAPTLLQLVTSVVSVNDHRNTSKVGNSHHPGICAAFAVLLKERNREMCGLQSIVSVLMYACYVQVLRGTTWISSVGCVTYEETTQDRCYIMLSDVKLLLLNSCTLVVTSPCWTTQSFLPSIGDVGENKENNIVTIIGIESI